MKFTVSEKYADIAYIHDRLYRYNLSKTGKPFSPDVHAPELPGMKALLLADDAGKTLGGAVWRPTDGGSTFFVEFLWVAEEARGTGAGSRLMAGLEKLARGLACRCIKLTTNTFQAPGFYRKLGFTVIGEKSEPVPLVPENIHYTLTKELK